MLKVADLANRADFAAGPLQVSPARRQVTGPVGSISVEPIVMKVFLLLLDARGSVVTRDDLFAHSWGGVFVGDDSLNRAIGRVRRIASDTAPGLFEIETIPRTGYRLTGDILDHLQGPATEVAEPIERRPISRRLILGGAAATAATAAIVGGGALWRVRHPPADARFGALLAEGEAALHQNAASDRTMALLKQAVALNPNSAKAWGLLAFAQSTTALDAGADRTEALVEAAKSSAGRALAINRNEPNALTAMALLQRGIEGWAQFDHQLRHVLAISPTNTLAMAMLVAVLQAAGLTRESWNLNQRALALEPLSPIHVFRKALKLWILGRVAESYAVIDRATELWPDNTGVWNARFLILAFTDRAQAALAMLDERPGMLGQPAAMAVWRPSLAALQTKTPEAIALARDANLEAARHAPGLAAHGVMVLGALGEIDAAYEIANGFLLSSGPVVVRAPTSSTQGAISSRAWKWTQWLFTPATRSLRSDARFAPLCDGIGLTDYWQARGVKPDYLTA